MLAAKVAAQRSRDAGPPEHAVPKLLTVHATISEKLKGHRIDGTGVVATSLPLRLRAAISRNDPAAIDKEFHSWEPLIEMPFTRGSRDATIENFGRIVNRIDVRYSCSVYRNWRLEGRKLRKDTVLEYFRLAENSEEGEEYRPFRAGSRS